MRYCLYNSKQLTLYKIKPLKGKVINIVEDDPLILENLIRYINLQADMKIGITTDSVESYLCKLKQSPEIEAQVLLLDVGLPGKSGLEALPIFRELQPNTDIIMLTTFEEEKVVLKAMCNGAVAYITKRTSLNQIIDAIRIVINGGSYMSPMIARDIFNFMVRTKTPEKSNILSKRHLEVLERIVDGKSYTTIAHELFISPETVRSHIKLIYRALEVNNKASAIKKYLAGYR